MSRKASNHLGQKYHRGIALEVIPLAYMPILSKVQKLFGGSVELRMAKNKAVRGSFWWFHRTFSALTLLVGCQEEHLACKNWMMRCWCGYLSGTRCRLFAYGPVDAAAVPNPTSSLASFKSRLVLPFWYQLAQVVLLNCSHPSCRWYQYQPLFVQ